MNQKFLAAAGAAAVLGISACAAHAVTVVNLGTFDSKTTVSGSIPYTSDELVDFKFTIDSPYKFQFSDSGSGGTFPFPIGSTATGGAGSYTETYGAYPVHGTLSYSLTTYVPEPAPWALLIVGVGAVGGATRRRRFATAA
jgi:hypothetical protein